MRIIRVFPRRTKATPTDELVRIGKRPDLFDEADEVHISVAFTWDIPLAEKLAREWDYVAPVKIGGPATGERGENFMPGMYLKKGYVITSRGCPNRCWFCSVPKREGSIRELPITEGWNVLDDNLLACSDDHIKAVFKMLGEQKMKGHRVEFTGGLEAARLSGWIADLLGILKPKQVFFAYDTPDDLEPLQEAGIKLSRVGLNNNSHGLRCYVLCGYPGDHPGDALDRMHWTMEAGFTPMAMLWKDETGKQDREWRKFQREWARPAIIYGRIPA